MMSKLDEAMATLMARVDRHSPDESKRVRAVLDDLVRWSTENAWGVSFSANGAAGQVRYCVEGMSNPFWALTPRSGDGARLTLLATAHARFPEDLRNEVRGVCAKIDGRVPEPDEVPSVRCGRLVWPPYLETVLQLMTRALNRVHGRVEEPALV